jgi:hypothetical protein
VHFILGQSASGSLRQGYRDACVATVSDWLSDGRCRFGEADDLARFLRARHAWWAETAGEDSLRACWSGPEHIRELEAAADGIQEAVLWLADGATERLTACWLAATLPRSVALEAAVPAKVRPDMAFQTIGMVPSEIMANTDLRAIAAPERQELAAAWQAFIEPGPERFFALVEEAAPASLLAGLVELKNRFPARPDGLDHWERMLLEEIAANPGRRATYAIARVLVSSRMDGSSEHSLLDTISEFAGAGLLHPHDADIGAMSALGEYRVTPLGEQILAGRRNRVDVTGFDRWFGGTHLSSASDDMWWRDGDRIVK